VSSRDLHWRIGDQDIACRIEGSADHGTFHVYGVLGASLPFRFLDSTHVEIGGVRHRFYLIESRDSCTVWIDGRTYELQRAKKAAASQSGGGSVSGEVRALMPGKLLLIAVAAGDAVAAKQPVAIMESMKMESVLLAPIAGRIAEIRFKPDDVVDMGDVVMVIEPGQ